MKITDFEMITREELLRSENALRKVIYHSTKTQVQLKDGIFTVGSLLKSQGREAMVWGA